MEIRQTFMPFKFTLMIFLILGIAQLPQAKQNVDPEVVEFLLVSTTKEFKSMELGRPTKMRKCRIGYIHDSGKDTFILTGSIKISGDTPTKWIPFTTIKTIDYEHWLGGSAESFWRQNHVKWFSGDYSKELLRRLNN